jgi:hypothetical protein
LHKRKQIFLGLLLMTVGLVCLTHLLEPPLEDWCSGIGYLPANGSTTSVHPVKVVVEPFSGRHQVYAIFQLDREKSPPGKPVILTVVGAGTYCEIGGSGGLLQHFDGVEANPGYYLSRHYIRTRTAIWLSFQGLFKQLKQPQSWTLTYVE